MAEETQLKKRSRTRYRLSAADVEIKEKAGRHADGGGLYLQVTEGEGGRLFKSWVYRFSFAGRSREMGLGPYPDVTLEDAREKTDECRRLLHRGTDPIEARISKREEIARENARAKTFSQVRAEYVASQRGAWSSAKHAAQWSSTLKTYAEPIFKATPVADIGIDLVLDVLRPIWHKIPETASRVRQRIEAVLDYAIVMEYRTKANPARWRHFLDKALPKKSEVAPTKHYPALPYVQVPAFIQDLRKHPGIAAPALEFMILTTTRTNSICGAQEREFDLDNGIWTVPASRVKGRKSMRKDMEVPLSKRAREIVAGLKRGNPGGYLFPGARPGKHMSNMAMLELVRGMKSADGQPWCDKAGRPVVPHGFRSSFKDWASDCTDHEDKVIEMALFHAIGDKVEAAYRRGVLLAKRTMLMDDWARYCVGEERRSGKVSLLLGIRDRSESQARARDQGGRPQVRRHLRFARPNAARRAAKSR